MRRVKKKKILERAPRYQLLPTESPACYMVDAIKTQEGLVLDFYENTMARRPEEGKPPEGQPGCWKAMWRTVINGTKEYANYDFAWKAWNTVNLRSMASTHQVSIQADSFEMQQETLDTIEKYVDAAGGYLYRKWQDSILWLQSDIQKERRITAEEKRFTQIQNRMARVPDPPGDFREYINETVYRDDHILYFSKSRAFCSRCGRTVKLKEPVKHNEMGSCPVCRKRVVFKNTRWIREHEDKKEVLYIQQFEGKLILRYFKTSLWSENGKKENLQYSESVRTYHGSGMRYEKRYVQYYDSLAKSCYWDDRMPYGRQVVYGLRSVLYTGNREELENLISGRHLELMVEWAKNGEPMPLKDFLQKTEQGISICERIHHAGMERLARDQIKNMCALNVQERELKKILGLNKDKMQYLREHDGGYRMLALLQDAERHPCGLSENEQFEIVEAGVMVSQIAQAAGNRKVLKTFHYLQRAKGYQTLQIRVSQYRDYRTMASELQYDLSNGTVCYPRNVEQAHNKATEELYATETDRKKGEANRKYPCIKEYAAGLDAAFGFQDREYRIVAPKDAGDIIEEGRVLHHCVGGAGYLSKHNSGQTFILFLRHMETLQDRYYTIELDPETLKIIQYYGAYDKKPDRPQVDAFLEKWKKYLRKRKK